MTLVDLPHNQVKMEWKIQPEIPEDAEPTDLSTAQKIALELMRFMAEDLGKISKLTPQGE